MNAKKSRQVRICECGQTFRTTAKFGNETCCDDCYAASQREFSEWLDQQPLDVLREIEEGIRIYCVENGVPIADDNKPECDAPAVEVNPEEVPHAEQDGIDAAFGEMMNGIDF